jgi:solute carrier family 25 phosphate transporter 23/24/25/41
VPVQLVCAKITRVELPALGCIARTLTRDVCCEFLSARPYANADQLLSQSGSETLKPKYGPKVLQLREMIAQPVFAAFCAGGVAGAVSRTVVSPLERLKILFQIQSVGREEYKLSVGKGLAKMWKDEGWRGLMRGNGTNCIRIVPYSAVQFGSYNFYKKVSMNAYPIQSVHRIVTLALDTFSADRYLESSQGSSLTLLQFFEPTPGADLSSVRRLICGGAAGITSVFFTYPLDIVRTRLSIQSASIAALGQGPKTKLPGMWATLFTMYKTEGGILALYRGIIPTVAGVAPYVS